MELFWLKSFLSSSAFVSGGSIQPVQVFDLPMADVYVTHWIVQGKKVPGARSPDSAVYLTGAQPGSDRKGRGVLRDA